MVSLVVHSTTFTFPVLHRAGDWHTDPLARWLILDLGSRLEWNWIRAATTELFAPSATTTTCTPTYITSIKKWFGKLV